MPTASRSLILCKFLLFATCVAFKKATIRQLNIYIYIYIHEEIQFKYNPLK